MSPEYDFTGYSEFMSTLQVLTYRHALTEVKSFDKQDKNSLYQVSLLLEKNQGAINQSMKAITRKSSQLLRMLWENGKRKTVYSFYANQTDLARDLKVTRQALSIHFKRLREAGLIQVGRGFINVTEEGLRTIGFNSNPVIVTVRISPQKRLEVFGKLRSLPAVEVFRVTGDVDVVLVVEQEKLDGVLGTLSAIDGILETKALLSIETMR